MRPEVSVRGTNIKGQKAAPMFHDVVAQNRFGKGSFLT